jgi:hypothetical protein
MVRFAFFGVLFGFVLSRVGATQYDAIAGMFLWTDLHLMGVIGVAIATAGIGIAWMRRAGVRASTGEPLALAPKPLAPGNIWGGLLFGAGWALSGACPGTALAQLGEGQLVALFTIAGMFAGTYLYQRFGARVERALPHLGLRRAPALRVDPAHSASAQAPASSV